MRFNRPKAKIRFKSDSNRLLIDFFDPISAVRFNRHYDTIRFGTQILNLNSNWWNSIKNWSNLFKNGQKRPDFVVFVIIFNIIHHFRLNS